MNGKVFCFDVDSCAGGGGEIPKRNRAEEAAGEKKVYYLMCVNNPVLSLLIPDSF